MTTPIHEIIPRDVRFGIAEHADRAWFDGDLLKTAAVDGLAVLLPEGERYFIRSLRHFAPEVKDEEILRGIQGYSRQEAFHSREHEGYNAALRQLGYDVDGMEAVVRQRLGRAKGALTRVVITCAIEQITYGMSRNFLRSPTLLAQANPAYRRLWSWHALEEVEHSAVAMRLLHSLPSSRSPLKRYLARVVVFYTVVISICQLALGNTLKMMRTNGQKVTPGMIARLAWLQFGNPGFIRRILVASALFLKPWYQGGGPDDEELIATGRRLLEEQGVYPAHS